MVRNRNGQWMDPRFARMMKLNLQQFAEGGEGTGAGEGGEGSSAGGEGGTGAAGNSAEEGENGGSAGEGGAADSVDALNAEIARLKAEVAKQKDALTKANKEAGDLRKDLRSKMTQVEIDAEAKKEAEEKAARELEDLRKEVAKGKTVKTVMGKLGLDEETAGSLSDCLYGAADIDNALLQIQKAWQAKEKALRLEFGKVTGPGAGADGNGPEAAAVRRATEIGKARNAQNEQAQKAMDAYLR